MARKPRLVAADALYHLMCRGVRKLPIYHADRDRTLFLALFRHTLQRFRWSCQAYCLMDTHFHLVVQTDDPTLSTGMHWLNTAYARTFNRRHGFEGHLFDRRFNSVLIEGDIQLAQTARYVELNPVRAGITPHPADWPWSSFRFHAGMSRSSLLTGSWLLDLFGRDSRRASAAYVEFVLDAIDLAVPPREKA